MHIPGKVHHDCDQCDACFASSTKTRNEWQNVLQYLARECNTPSPSHNGCRDGDRQQLEQECILHLALKRADDACELRQDRSNQEAQINTQAWLKKDQ
jgi:hypothetical protein